MKKILPWTALLALIMMIFGFIFIQIPEHKKEISIPDKEPPSTTELIPENAYISYESPPTSKPSN